MRINSLEGSLEFANVVKEVVLEALVLEGYISSEHSENFNKNYAVNLRGPGWFGKILENFRGTVSKGFTKIEVVKFVDFPKEQKKKE